MQFTRRFTAWCVFLATLATVGAASAQSLPSGRAGQFRIAPYVQNVAQDHATVMWEAEQAGESAVRYGVVGGATTRTAPVGTRDGQIHRVRLTGLRPDTRYWYAVPGYPKRCGFRTAPAANRRIRFAVIGDSRFWGQLWENSRLPEHLGARSSEFALHMGDLVDRGSDYTLWPAHFTRFQSLLQSAPIFAVRGNHEGGDSDPATNWFTKYHELPGGEPYSSFDWGPCHIAILSILGMTDNTLPAALAWLDKDLGASRKPWKLVAFHVPVYCTGYMAIDDSRKSRGIRAIEDVIDRHNVDMVLAGHTHIYERSFPYRAGARDDRRGAIYLVQGGNVGGHYPDMWSALVQTGMDMPHYTAVEMTSERIELRTFGLARGSASTGRAAPIVEVDHVIRTKGGGIPTGAIAALGSPDARRRLDAIEELGAMAYAPATAKLLGALDDPDDNVQRAAALAIERIAPASISAELASRLKHRIVEVRRRMARALECAMDASVAAQVAVAAADESEDPQVRINLLGALALRAPAEALAPAYAAVRSTNVDVRRRASDVLKRLAPASDVSRLLGLYEAEPDAFAAGSLAWGLNRLTGKLVSLKEAAGAPVGSRSKLLAAWRSP